MGFTKKTWSDRKTEYPNRRLLTKEDGTTELVTVSREEGTISTEGDAFSAENMNDLETRVNDAFTEVNSNLTADNGTPFRFGYSSETEEYGYIVTDSEGADTFCPFSSGDATTLYKALQYSGLVTEDMSFDEMCAVLAEHFPAFMNLFTTTDGIKEGYEIYNRAPSISSSGIYWSDASVKQTSYLYYPSVDLTSFSTMKVTFDDSYIVSSASVYLYVFPENAVSGAVKGTSVSDGYSGAGTMQLDISSLSGKYCIAIGQYFSNVKFTSWKLE